MAGPSGAVCGCSKTSVGFNSFWSWQPQCACHRTVSLCDRASRCTAGAAWTMCLGITLADPHGSVVVGVEPWSMWHEPRILVILFFLLWAFLSFSMLDRTRSSPRVAVEKVVSALFLFYYFESIFSSNMLTSKALNCNMISCFCTLFCFNISIFGPLRWAFKTTRYFL